MLVKTSEFDVQGNMPGTTMDMSLSGDSLEHIMDILSDLYSNRPAAVIREYSTNALDAHIISGQTKPIEIQTPNRLNPSLVIRDYGNGMSKQVLIDTYSKYGASTKRSNNLEAGQLGLGSKSGFAYTDQFTVRSVHDGHCCEIIMSRNDRGAAEMTIAVDYETSDPSGVTITIPVPESDVHSMGVYAKDFASYAAPGTIMLDGVLNSHPEVWGQISEDIYFTDTIRNHMVVMGNVGYPVKIFAEDWPWSARQRLIFFVDMGDVDFTPSREELKYTRHTTQTIERLEEHFKTEFQKYATKDLGANPARIDVIKSWGKLSVWRPLISYGVIPDPRGSNDESIFDGTESFRVSLPSDINDPDDHVCHSENTKRKLDIQTAAHLIKNAGIVISDFKAKRLNRDHARKIVAHDSAAAGQLIHLFEGSKDEIGDLVPDAVLYSWEDIKGVKVVKQKTSVKNVSTGFYKGVKIHNRRIIKNGLFEPTGPVYYCSQSYWNGVGRIIPRGDYKVLFVTPSKAEAFLKKNPHAKSLESFINQRRDQCINQINKLDAYNFADARFVGFNPMDFKDESFRGLIIKSKTSARVIRSSGRYVGYGLSNKIESEYPLLAGFREVVSQKHKSHIINYVNMIGEKNASV